MIRRNPDMAHTVVVDISQPASLDIAESIVRE